MQPYREIITTVYKIPLPETAQGVSAPNGQDRYIVLINKDLPEDEQAAAFLHEMAHIWENAHTQQDRDVTEIEARALELLKKAAGQDSN